MAGIRFIITVGKLFFNKYEIKEPDKNPALMNIVLTVLICGCEVVYKNNIKLPHTNIKDFIQFCI